jgi:hypothetical protein
VRENVGGVGRGMGHVVLEGKSTLENVCFSMQNVTREMVERHIEMRCFMNSWAGWRPGTRRFSVVEGLGIEWRAEADTDYHQGEVEGP